LSIADVTEDITHPVQITRFHSFYGAQVTICIMQNYIIRIVSFLLSVQTYDCVVVCASTMIRIEQEEVGGRQQSENQLPVTLRASLPKKSGIACKH
jgi:hypothetical protein